MATYSSPGDCTDDPLLTVEESQCKFADTRVNGALAAKGILKAEVADLLPNEDLTALAVAFAYAKAALEGARGDASLMMDKHRAYENLAKSLAAGITRQSLGLALADGTTGGYGSIEIGRG